MTTQPSDGNGLSGSQTRTKLPAGVVILAILCFCASTSLLVLALLARAGVMSLMSANFLLQGLELMGSVIFYLTAALTTAAGIGLLRRWKVARWAVLVLICGVGVGRIMPISSAVIDFRILGIVRDGAIIIATVIAIRYLLQEEMREWFET